HVFRHRPADPAGDPDLRPVDQAAAEVAEAAVDGDPAPGEDADRDRVLGARVLDRDVGDALVVDQPAQLQGDLAGGQVGGVEDRRAGIALALDDRVLRGLGVRLGQAAGVVADLHRVHTSTWRSYGS